MSTSKKVREILVQIRHCLKFCSSPTYRKLVWAEDAWYRECEERDKRLNEEAERSWLQHCQEQAAQREAEEKRFWDEQDRLQDEQYRLQEDAYADTCEERRRLKEELDEYGCECCGELDCTCRDHAEDFSEHPSLSAEDDVEPLSPEMEYWNTRCTKCNMYPEFCWCGMEKLE